MKSLVGCVALLSFLQIPAQARLGEKPHEIAVRFGVTAPLVLEDHGADNGLSLQRFKAKGFDIQILYSDVSVGETYRGAAKLTESQVQAMLTAQSEGHTWKQTSKTAAGVRFWTRDDGAQASLWFKAFYFRSKALCDKEEAWRKAGQPDAKGI